MSSESRPPTLDDSFEASPSSVRWLEMAPGVRRATLLKDPDREFSVMYLRFDPGASAMRHVHPDGEQFVVLEGSIEDADGRYEAGAFVNRPPGSTHEPRSETGALVLVTWFGRLEAY